MISLDSDIEFEAEVRRVAAQLFPRSTMTGPVNIAGRERDGLYDDGQTINILEATTSRKRDKVSSDLTKSKELVSLIRRERPDYNVTIWLVTAHSPTADQLEAAVEVRKKTHCPVVVVGFTDFRAKLFDTHTFLRLRANHPFGSIRRPEDDNDHRVPEPEYIEIPLYERTTQKSQAPREIAKLAAASPIRAVVLGDYGAGKSMALRAIYAAMRDSYTAGHARAFPVYINLRDHFGNTDPSVVLYDHARRIGCNEESRLVAAWKAGFCEIILDGFDELSPTQFSTTAKNLRFARSKAVSLVKAFFAQSPKTVSVLTGGRRHYFDDSKEMISALGLSDLTLLYDLNELTDLQVKAFTKGKLGKIGIPAWLPKRPLLIGYLLAGGYLEGNPQRDIQSRSEGWNYLLDRIGNREIEQISDAGITGVTIRTVLERLATVARRTTSGRGPIDLGLIAEVFEDVFSLAPDERSLTLLLRLPGLASVAGRENAREFIDDDFADACRAGDIQRYIMHPFSEKDRLIGLEAEAGSLAIEMVADQTVAVTERQFSMAIDQATSNDMALLAADTLRCLIMTGHRYVGEGAEIADGYFSEFETDAELDIGRIAFVDCYFEHVAIGTSSLTLNVAHVPKFNSCIIGTLTGFAGKNDIPAGIFDSKSVLENILGVGESNAATMDSELPTSVKVLMTILKKLYLQGGSARQEAALSRGLDHRARAHVAEILNVLGRLGLAERVVRRGITLWAPVRDKVSDVRTIRDAPSTSNHAVLRQVREL